MAYRNYYAKRVAAQAGLRRPGSIWGARRPAYGYRPGAYGALAQRTVYRPGYRPGYHPGYRPGYRGVVASRYWPGRYGTAAWPNRQNLGWRFGRGYQHQHQHPYGYASQPGYPSQPGYGSQPGYVPQQDAPQAPGQALPPQWIAWAQSCLAKVVGTWVPQNGEMGKATRHAIKKFQKQNQLPPTGMLDTATVNALQAACSGQASAPADPSGSPPPPDAAPPAGDDAAAAGAPPDAGAAPDGGAPPDAQSGELFMRKKRRHHHHHQRRRWGSGFNFQQNQQQQQPDNDGDDDDDDSELFMGMGRRRWHRRHWGSGFNFQPSAPTPPPDSGDEGEFFMGRGGFRRSWGGGGGGGYQQPDDGNSWMRRRRQGMFGEVSTGTPAKSAPAPDWTITHSGRGRFTLNFRQPMQRPSVLKLLFLDGNLPTGFRLEQDPTGKGLQWFLFIPAQLGDVMGPAKNFSKKLGDALSKAAEDNVLSLTPEETEANRKHNEKVLQYKIPFLGMTVGQAFDTYGNGWFEKNGYFVWIGPTGQWTKSLQAVAISKTNETFNRDMRYYLNKGMSIEQAQREFSDRWDENYRMLIVGMFGA